MSYKYRLTKEKDGRHRPSTFEVFDTIVAKIQLQDSTKTLDLAWCEINSLNMYFFFQNYQYGF